MVNYILNTTTGITQVVSSDGYTSGVYWSDEKLGAFVGIATDGTRQVEQTRRKIRQWFEDRDHAAKSRARSQNRNGR